MELQENAGHYKKDRMPVYREKEAEIRAVLSEMPSAGEILAMLARVGMNRNDFYALYGKEKVGDAVLYAKELKDRYTVLWMYYDFYGGETVEL